VAVHVSRRFFGIFFVNKPGSIDEEAVNDLKEKIDDVSNIAEIWLGALLRKKK
jgi:hypothetical protein